MLKFRFDTVDELIALIVEELKVAIELVENPFNSSEVNTPTSEDVKAAANAVLSPLNIPGSKLAMPDVSKVAIASEEADSAFNVLAVKLATVAEVKLAIFAVFNA